MRARRSACAYGSGLGLPGLLLVGKNGKIRVVTEASKGTTCAKRPTIGLSEQRHLDEVGIVGGAFDVEDHRSDRELDGVAAEEVQGAGRASLDGQRDSLHGFDGERSKVDRFAGGQLLHDLTGQPGHAGRVVGAGPAQLVQDVLRRDLRLALLGEGTSGHHADDQDRHHFLEIHFGCFLVLRRLPLTHKDTPHSLLSHWGLPKDQITTDHSKSSRTVYGELFSTAKEDTLTHCLSLFLISFVAAPHSYRYVITKH